MNRGKVVILVIFALAIALTGYAWWFHLQQSARVVENWSAATARLIRRSERVWLLRLSDERNSENQSLKIGEKKYAIASREDITKANGLIHVRHFLAEDSYFDWSDEKYDCGPKWTFAFEFEGRDQSQTLAFDPRCHRVVLISTQARLKLGPVMKRLVDFVENWESAKENGRGE